MTTCKVNAILIGSQDKTKCKLESSTLFRMACVKSRKPFSTLMLDFADVSRNGIPCWLAIWWQCQQHQRQQQCYHHHRHHCSATTISFIHWVNEWVEFYILLDTLYTISGTSLSRQSTCPVSLVIPVCNGSDNKNQQRKANNKLMRKMHSSKISYPAHNSNKVNFHTCTQTHTS